MDLTIVRSFLNEHLSTREAVEGAAAIADVSVATMYRYKANPDGMSLGVLSKLSSHLGLPLSNGAAWGKVDVLGSERRRFSLESMIASVGGKRLTTVAPYTVNDEIPEITQALLKFDYGTRAAAISDGVLALRAKRAALYRRESYDSWEIWNSRGYSDFYFGRGRFASLPESLRRQQIDQFLKSSESTSRHRFFYDEPEFPMFGCYSPPGVGLIRVEDVHFEFQEFQLVSSLEDTFNELLGRAHTKTTDEFVAFLSNPSP